MNPCTNKLVYAKFGVAGTFLCVFLSRFRVFLCYELWIKIPVTIFFSKVNLFSRFMIKTSSLCDPFFVGFFSRL